jgi:8-oxo-dGTP pyrophosphatase MutT (NUDIX family)
VVEGLFVLFDCAWMSRRLFSIGALVAPRSVDLWRYSRTHIQTKGKEIAALRSFLFQHTLQVAEANHILVQAENKQKTHAGILVPVYEDGLTGELHVLFTERSADLNTHGGEVSFPGGKTDPGEDDLDAAVREAEEEIGLSNDNLEVLGCLPAMPSKKGLVCSPWVALIDFQEWFPKPNTGEVADWFSVPIKWLMSESNLRIVQFSGWTSYEWNFIRESDKKTFRIWGLTGTILLYLLVSAFKFAPAGIIIFVLFYFYFLLFLYFFLFFSFTYLIFVFYIIIIYNYSF